MDFSSRGTRHFVLTSVSMTRPFQVTEALEAYKYDCLEYGLSQEYFHCADDNVHVRAKVFDIICAHLDGIEVNSLIVDKRKTSPALQSEHRFYPEMLGNLVKFVLSSPSHVEADEVIIITDTVPLHRRRQAIEKAIKGALARMVPSGTRYRVLHHDSRSHHGLQIADYCCWAIFRKHEKGDQVAFDRLRPAIRSEFDIFRRGTRYYY